MDSTPFVAVTSIDKNVYVVIRQQVNQHINEIVVNETQFSGLMYGLKAIEEKMREDERAKNVAEAVEQCLYDPSVPAYDGGITKMYDPAIPACDIEATPICQDRAIPTFELGAPQKSEAPKPKRKRKLKMDV